MSLPAPSPAAAGALAGPGLPLGDLARATAGMRRQAGTAACALLCAWSGVWLAVWLLVLNSALGALLGLLGTAFAGGTVGGLGVSVLGVAGSAVSAAATALGSAVATLLVDQPVQFLASLAGGLAVSVAALATASAAEPWLLSLRGCRRMSRREAERLTPLLEACGRDLGLADLPRVLMAGGGSLRVRAHARHLVVGPALLEELGEDQEATASLAAVLCHGLWHWASGDGVADRWILCCGLPLAAVYNAGCWLAEQSNAIIATAGWVILWPAWVLVRLVLRPVATRGSRAREHEADAAVATTGRGPALHRALSLLGELEPGQGGWDRALAATHPALELRLEALEPAPGS